MLKVYFSVLSILTLNFLSSIAKPYYFLKLITNGKIDGGFLISIPSLSLQVWLPLRVISFSCFYYYYIILFKLSVLMTSGYLFLYKLFIWNSTLWMNLESSFWYSGFSNLMNNSHWICFFVTIFRIAKS